MGQAGPEPDRGTSPAGTAIDDLAAELGEQVAMLRRVTHMAARQLGAPCPQCDLPALVRWPHSRYECRYCRTLVTRPEYDRLADDAIAALDRQGAA